MHNPIDMNNEATTVKQALKAKPNFDLTISNLPDSRKTKSVHSVAEILP